MPIQDDDLVNRFTPHPPERHSKAEAGHERIRQDCLDLARLIVAYTPASREQSLALTNLEQCAFWSNAAIARHP